MSADGVLLFVYGTLMRRVGGDWPRRMAELASYAGRARMPGRLYSLGWYPGLVLPAEAGEVVHGEVWRLADPDAAFAVLDPYEECVPGDDQGSLYLRLRREAELENGERAACWVYVYNRPVREADRLPGGDFAAPASETEPGRA